MQIEDIIRIRDSSKQTEASDLKTRTQTEVSLIVDKLQQVIMKEPRIKYIKILESLSRRLDQEILDTQC